MHRVDPRQAAQAVAARLLEARDAGEFLRLQGDAETKLAMQDDLGLAHFGEWLGEHAPHGGPGECRGGEANEPGLQMPHALGARHHAPGIGCPLPHRGEDRAKVVEGAEHAVVGEQDLVRPRRAAQA